MEDGEYIGPEYGEEEEYDSDTEADFACETAIDRDAVAEANLKAAGANCTDANDKVLYRHMGTETDEDAAEHAIEDVCGMDGEGGIDTQYQRPLTSEKKIKRISLEELKKEHTIKASSLKPPGTKRNTKGRKPEDFKKSFKIPQTDWSFTWNNEKPPPADEEKGPLKWDKDIKTGPSEEVRNAFQGNKFGKVFELLAGLYTNFYFLPT